MSHRGRQHGQGRDRRIGRHGGQGGFTLLEVLLALTLLALTITLMFSGMRFGIRAWDRVVASSEHSGRVFLAQDFLRRSLGRVREVEWQKPPRDEAEARPVGGDQERLTFLAPAPLRWAGAPLYRYELRLERDAEQLVIAYRPVVPWARQRLEAEEEVTVLADGVHGLRLEYFGTADGEDRPRWRDRWREQSLPRRIRMELEWPEGGARAWPRFTFVLPEPAAAKGEGRPAVDFGPN